MPKGPAGPDVQAVASDKDEAAPGCDLGALIVRPAPLKATRQAIISETMARRLIDM